MTAFSFLGELTLKLILNDLRFGNFHFTSHFFKVKFTLCADISALLL